MGKIQRLDSRRPLFLHYLRLFTSIGIFLSLFSYFYLDKTLSEYLAHNAFKHIAFWISLCIDPFLHLILWPTLYLFGQVIRKTKEKKDAFLLITLSVGVSNFIVECLKIFFGRARPELLFSKQKIYGFTFFDVQDLFQSLPSGHACTAGSLLGVLACYFRKQSIPLLILALSLFFSRVLLDVHFLSDIISGVFIGALIGQWTYKSMKEKIPSFSI